MEIKKINRNDIRILEQVKNLLLEAFPHSYYCCADDEVVKLISEDRILIGAFNDNGILLGFAGAIPQYSNTGWELHPIVIKEEFRFRGIGSMLLKGLEDAVDEKGGITIYLGTDDEFGKTSLSGNDLYDNLFDKIRDITNIRKHPFEFYIKNGYRIVGVIPDANGLGKPDIIMAKRITNRKEGLIE
ncbi:MAG: GNAT family N-acetyltransferase [Clostridia bacterium]